VRWLWVRGHRGNRWNERADTLATQALRSRTPRRQQATRLDAAETSGPARATEQRPLIKYEIFCRACALGSPGPAGYAAVVVRSDGKAVERTGAWPLATNNEMELWAVIAGLQSLPGPSSVTVYTPSQYVLGGATRWLAGWERNGWRTSAGQPVKNRELWRELSQVMGDHDVRWEHLGPDASGDWAGAAARLAREQAERQRELQPDE
jgi:ribonuclease HI